MSTPYWLEEPSTPRASRPSAGRAEVAVIGGGVTGCACALTLAENGLKVRVYEAREIASGASGRNGGFALRGGEPAYDSARATLGEDGARSLWRLSERALERLESLAGDAFRKTGSIRLAADPEEADELRAEYEALVADGFAAEWCRELEAPLTGYYGAVFHPTDGSLFPARWVRRLAERAEEAGAEIREHARVASLEELDADAVVVATDGYTQGLIPSLDGAVRPTRGQVLVTAALEEMRYPRPHYARHGYDYWQQLPDGRLVIGGHRDHALDDESTIEEATTPLIQRLLEEQVAELTGRRPAITHRWAGIFGLTEDRLPLVGPVPERASTWVACGYSGHGNVLGLACGELVADALLGRPAPELQLFRPERLLAPP